MRLSRQLLRQSFCLLYKDRLMKEGGLSLILRTLKSSDQMANDDLLKVTSEDTDTM